MPYGRGYGGTRRRDMLTGGTGDTNPQVYGIVVAQSGNDVGSETELPVPVLRMGMSMSRAQVIEVTRVQFEVPTQLLSAIDNNQSIEVSLTSRSIGATPASLAEPNLLAKFNRNNQTQSVTAASVYGYNQDNIITFDLTDGAGHGILVTSANLYFQQNSTNTAVTNTFGVRIFYRFKQIGARAFAAAAIN